MHMRISIAITEAGGHEAFERGDTGTILPPNVFVALDYGVRIVAAGFDEGGPWMMTDGPFVVRHGFFSDGRVQHANYYAGFSVEAPDWVHAGLLSHRRSECNGCAICRVGGYNA